jgi:hypothetical protein
MLRFYVDPKNILVHHDYIDSRKQSKDIALIELTQD